ncbi:MAG: aspartate/glutamate racemase family protein, partial [Anaerolineales bacterium]|nr:aspartate/glutamate racemase family protein [Anaerolineales bacterium]
PGVAIATVIAQLERCGATVVGIPCNTAHAPSIFEVIKENVVRRGSAVTLVDMVSETVAFLRVHHAGIERVGVLGTTGAQRARVYPRVLESNGLQAVVPTDDDQERIIHPAIVDKRYGIKACSLPVSQRARNDLISSVRTLASAGAEAVVLGCTEIPLAITEKHIDGVVIVDPTLILARALIRAIAPEKLLPLH